MPWRIFYTIKSVKLFPLTIQDMWAIDELGKAPFI